MAHLKKGTTVLVYSYHRWSTTLRMALLAVISLVGTLYVLALIGALDNPNGPALTNASVVMAAASATMLTHGLRMDRLFHRLHRQLVGRAGVIDRSAEGRAYYVTQGDDVIVVETWHRIKSTTRTQTYAIGKSQVRCLESVTSSLILQPMYVFEIDSPDSRREIRASAGAVLRQLSRDLAA